MGNLQNKGVVPLARRFKREIHGRDMKHSCCTISTEFPPMRTKDEKCLNNHGLDAQLLIHFHQKDILLSGMMFIA